MTVERSNDVVIVAQRELHDLLYRCGRVIGIDPATAAELAQIWTVASAEATIGTDQPSASSLPLPRGVFDGLAAAAAPFLVSESVIDGLIDDG